MTMDFGPFLTRGPKWAILGFKGVPIIFFAQTEAATFFCPKKHIYEKKLFFFSIFKFCMPFFN